MLRVCLFVGLFVCLIVCGLLLCVLLLVGVVGCCRCSLLVGCCCLSFCADVVVIGCLLWLLFVVAGVAVKCLIADCCEFLFYRCGAGLLLLVAG